MAYGRFLGTVIGTFKKLVDEDMKSSSSKITRLRKTPQGIYFDLADIFTRLNGLYFAGGIEASLRWGPRRKSDRPQASVRLGSYFAGDRLITINPILDQAMVPLFCVERVVFHEMNHQKCPTKKLSNGKNQFHTPEFYAFEKNYPYLDQADLWIKANLTRLLKK